MSSEIATAQVAGFCSNCTDSILKDDRYLIFREEGSADRNVCIACASVACDEPGSYRFDCDAVTSLPEVQTVRLKI